MDRHKLFRSSIAALAVTGVFTAHAAASLTSEFIPVNITPGLLDGYVSQDLAVTTTTDWQAANLLVTLASGSIYQDAVGADTSAPNPLFFPTFPTLEFDTYIKGWSSGQAASTLGGAVDLGGSPTAQFNSSGININWYTSDLDDIGVSTIGRFTLSDDATGTWKLLLAADVPNSSSDLLVTVEGTIINGQFVVPEPASLALVLTGLTLMAPRRGTRRQGASTR